MCGIWGFVGNKATVKISDAWDGLCSLTSRGPDDWGLYVNGAGKVSSHEVLPDGDSEVVLGNRRLSILDLSEEGNQPMHVDEETWIVYNGEVYNYRELRKDLRKEGYSFESETDTEVVLKGYKEYGSDVVNRLRGMFAFAIYDEPSGELFAARDRFGIKPFYYDLSTSGLAFASQVTSLLDSDVSDRKLDPVAVDGYLTFGYVPSPLTIIDGIQELPPGSTLTYDCSTGAIERDTFWKQTFEPSEACSEDELRNLLRESVSLRLRSDVPVGAFLSGGLDSSTLVAMMREVAGDERENLVTCSIDFNSESHSEATYAEQVADEFDTDHTTRTVRGSDVRSDINKIITAMDQPTIDGVNTYYISKTASDLGLKVALSGLGSDELLFGYPTFANVKKYHRYGQLANLAPLLVRRPFARFVETAGNHFETSIPTAKIADSLQSSYPFGTGYVLSRGLFTRPERESLTIPRANEWQSTVEESVEQTLSESTLGNGVSQAELSWYMQCQLLRDTDAMSMAHSIEVRVPFLDSPLAERVLTVPTKRKSEGEKQLLKDAVSDIVPLEITERDKTGFVFPFGEWLTEELKPVVDAALTDAQLRNAFIDPESASEARQSFERGKTHWSTLWSLVVLSLWVQEHITTESTSA